MRLSAARTRWGTHSAPQAPSCIGGGEGLERRVREWRTEKGKEGLGREEKWKSMGRKGWQGSRGEGMEGTRGREKGGREGKRGNWSPIFQNVVASLFVRRNFSHRILGALCVMMYVYPFK